MDDVERELRAMKLRFFWRDRLKKMGIDPHKLDVDDPVWARCFRRPRGAVVLLAAAELRSERPGIDLRTDDGVEAVLARVAEIEALPLESMRAARYAAAGITSMRTET